jgi:menaquinone-9 beta-reductase
MSDQVLKNTTSKKVAILGAGPAGASLAFFLADKGIRVTLFDGSHPREKPCGGVTSAELLNKWNFLQEYHEYGTIKTDKYYTTFLGQSFKIPFIDEAQTLLCFQRKSFDRFILNLAQKKGTEWIPQHVISLENESACWKIRAKNGLQYDADVIVGADGAFSMVRRKIYGHINRSHFALGLGYRFPGLKTANIHTVFYKKGIWGFILPGFQETRVVLASRLEHRLSRKELDEFTNQFIPKDHPKIFFGGIQPLPLSPSFYQFPRSGDNFMLIGDAAGFCNAMNGEGIKYAIESAYWASEAIIKENILSYDLLWRKAFEAELKQASKFSFMFSCFGLLFDIPAFFLSKFPLLGSVCFKFKHFINKMIVGNRV